MTEVVSSESRRYRPSLIPKANEAKLADGRAERSHSLARTESYHRARYSEQSLGPSTSEHPRFARIPPVIAPAKPPIIIPAREPDAAPSPPPMAPPTIAPGIPPPAGSANSPAPNPPSPPAKTPPMPPKIPPIFFPSAAPAIPPATAPAAILHPQVALGSKPNGSTKSGELFLT
jgi:hypothetical protein